MSGDVLEAYLREAPVSLALERAIESRLLAEMRLEAPVLDLGCGDGLFASLTFPAGLAAGVDRDAAELRRASDRRAYRLLGACDATALPFRDASFATIVSNSALEHFADLEAALREARRVLRPAGRFCFTVPSPRYGRLLFHAVLLRTLGLEALSRRYEHLVNVRLQRNLHCLDVPEWRELLRGAGLVLDRATSYLPRAVMFANDLGYPLALPAMVWKRTLGRWVIAPAARRPLARVLGRLLKPLYLRACDDAHGAGWLIEARAAG